MCYKKSKGFTLTELLTVIVIIGVLATLGLPNYVRSREQAFGREAWGNLNLIAVAEKTYRLEANPTTYYIPSPPPPPPNIADINNNLKLLLSVRNWDYSITGGANTFTAYANRQGTGGYLDCQYSINESPNEPVVASASGTCP